MDSILIGVPDSLSVLAVLLLYLSGGRMQDTSAKKMMVVYLAVAVQMCTAYGDQSVCPITLSLCSVPLHDVWEAAGCGLY